MKINIELWHQNKPYCSLHTYLNEKKILKEIEPLIIIMVTSLWNDKQQTLWRNEATLDPSKLKSWCFLP